MDHNSSIKQTLLNSSCTFCQFFRRRVNLLFWFSTGSIKNTEQCCDSTSCRTLFGRSDLGVVGSEPGEVLLTAGDQREQHDVSRGHEGQRVVRVSTLSGETISTFTGPALHFLIKESTTEIFGKVSRLCLTLSGLCSLSERASRRSWRSLARSRPPGSECGSPVGPGVLGRPAASTAGRRSAGTTSPETPETGRLPALWRGNWTTFSLENITRQTRLWIKSITVSKTSDMFESWQMVTNIQQRQRLSNQRILNRVEMHVVSDQLLGQ